MKGRETRDWDMSTSAIEWTRGAGELSGLGFAAFQRGLTAYNSSRMRPGLPEESPSGELDLEHVVAQAEVIFIETQRRAIAPFVADIPSGTDAFMAWYEGLKQTGPGQGDPRPVHRGGAPPGHRGQDLEPPGAGGRRRPGPQRRGDGRLPPETRGALTAEQRQGSAYGGMGQQEVSVAKKQDDARAQGFKRGLKGRTDAQGMTQGWTDDKESSVARSEGWIAGKRKRSQIQAEETKAKETKAKAKGKK